MNLDEAYKAKGIAATQIEYWQSKLREANQAIGQGLAAQQKDLFQTPVKPETKAAKKKKR